MNKLIAVLGICLSFVGCIAQPCETPPMTTLGQTNDQPTQCLDCNFDCLIPCKNGCPNDPNKAACESACRTQCCYGIGNN